MSSVNPDWKSQTGSDTGGDGGFIQRNRTLELVVQTDDIKDGPDVVLALCNTAGYVIGAAYAVGNDTDANITLRAMTPNREGGVAERLWKVSCSYENEQLPSKEGLPGEDTTPPSEGQGDSQISWNPLQWRDELEVISNRTTRQATDAVYKGFSFTKPATQNAYRLTGDKGPVLICSGEQKNVTRDDTRFEVRISSWRTTFDMDLFTDMVDSVNSLGLTIGYAYANWSRLFPAESIKLAAVSGRFMRINYVDIWRVTFQLQVRSPFDNTIVNSGGQEEPQYWRHVEPNISMNQRAEKGDPDGLGGTIQDDPLAGAPLFRRILDANHKPVSQPAQLDLAGQPNLDIDNLGTTHGSWLPYELYPAKPFAALQLGSWANP